jgi:P27 family predicted phage terminase small subunit
MPEWLLWLDDDSEILAARERWRVIVTTQADLGLLDPTNAPLITRLVLAQILCDRAMREVAQNGAVISPKKSSSRSIARVSPHFQAMTKLNKEILELESHLGLTPRTRGKVRKTELRKTRRTTPADEFLRVIPGGRGKPSEQQ